MVLKLFLSWIAFAVLLLGAACSLPPQTSLLPPPPHTSLTHPSVVTIEKDPDGTWRYKVDGTPEWVIGIGYNPVYRYLPDDERKLRYQRDFQAFREAGITLLVMWTAEKGALQDPVDELLLDTAADYGIGAIIPFFFPPKEDYRNPVVQEQLRQHVIDTVQKFRNHPALRMWGLGNETLLELPQEMYRPWAHTFLEEADLIHTLDPNHPVLYRESEDLYVVQLMRLFGRGGIDRPWLHYGMNIYTQRIDSILDGWNAAGFDKPLFIQEFGPPYDYDYPNREANYLKMWASIRQHKQIVFGAAPYTWMAPGPDPYDGFYGLVSSETARPMDGTWAALSDAFRQARQEDAASGDSPPS